MRTFIPIIFVAVTVLLGCVPLHAQPPLTHEQIEEGIRQLEIQKKAEVARTVIARDASADASMLDLSPLYDMNLPNLPVERDIPFRFLKPGTHVWDGIKFDVRGMIDPGFNDWDEIEFDYHNGIPNTFSWWKTKTNNIPVGRKVSEIDFLHGVFGIAGAPSNTVSQFIIHFANGHNETVPIIFAKDVSDSNVASVEFNEYYDKFVPTNAVVVWETRPLKKAPPQPVFKFFIKKWINPFPNETVETIGFQPMETSGAYSGAFLVAITVRPFVNKNQ